ncbi:MAG: hypothetical protein G3M78_10350 [Candidatus Nitrohelix vancouverensis]|uniref:Cytochrome c domain-containing protein n=1 Tax=Candidatus Nitrohelix vancouverensis TaxID=2705534 RepID=A0A7T0C3E2_9BACT|nr:MAG: hypothetical protein G3M78_10350 [Candidatus Nitrohelix vancouverensis]
MMVVSKISGVLLLIILALFSACAGPVDEKRSQVSLSLSALSGFSAKEMGSRYFDRAMSYQDSRFEAISLTEIASAESFEGADALLLDCRDDYEGVVSLADIRDFDLHMATKIMLKPGIAAPDWLQAGLILVPDHIKAPFQERFVTANVRTIRSINLDEYYRPLHEAVRKKPEYLKALQTYKDNCLFCHSLGSVGGKKGGGLLEKFRFEKEEGRRAFAVAFIQFHNQGNMDKQNMEQFVSPHMLSDLAGFLYYMEGLSH